MTPLYDYACEKCETQFEAHVPLTEFDKSHQAKCPECSELASRVMSPVKSYRISGDNSASVTPRKFRGQ